MDNKIRTEVIRYFRPAAGSNNALEVKAYEVYPNIWVIPSRYVIEPLQELNEVSNPEQFGVYDKNYLTKEQERDEYLKSVQEAIEKIKHQSSGWELLTAISGAVPLPKDTVASNTTLQCLENGKHTHNVVANVVLWGPGNNLNLDRVISRSVKDDSDGTGSMVEINWNPKIAVKNVGTNQIKPPIDNLICLLTKALFRLYGLGLNKIRYPFYQLNNKKYYSMFVEDMIANGGFSANAVNLQPYYFLENKFSEINTNYETAKHKIDEIQVNSEYRELLTLKYQFDLYSLFHIWTSSMISTVLPANDKCGGLTTYYAGPDAIVNSADGSAVQNLSKIPSKRIKYENNVTKEYDEYDFTDGQNFSQYFDDFTFPENINLTNPTQSISENAFVNLPSTEISNIVLPIIPATNDLVSVPLVQVIPDPITTEIVTSKVPTLGLAITAVKTEKKLSTVQMTTKLIEALNSNTLTFVFSSVLAERLSGLSTITDANLFELIKIIKNELLSSIDDYTEFSNHGVCPEWVNYCFHEIYGESLKNLIEKGKFEKIFAINDTLKLPNKLPKNINQLKPYLFYQWYAKRYTRILRIESLFYQLLCEHIKTIRELVQPANMGSYMDDFLNDLSKVAYTAQYMLSDWTEHLGYQDYQTQLNNVLQQASSNNNLTIDDISYDCERFMLTINEFSTNSISDFVSPQALRRIQSDSNSPVLLLGNDIVKDIGVMKVTDDSLDNENSFLFEKNVGFEGDFSAKYIISSIRAEFIFKFEGNLHFSVDIANINITLVNNICYITQGLQEKKSYEISKFIGWNSLAYVVTHSSVEIWDLYTNELLVRDELNVPQNNGRSAVLRVLSTGDKFLLRSFKVFEKSAESDYLSLNRGFKNGLIYTNQKEPVITNQGYELKSVMLGKPGVLIEELFGYSPLFSISDTGSDRPLDLTLEAITNEKVSTENGYHIFLKTKGRNYFGVGRFGYLTFVDKAEAGIFYLKQARIDDTSLVGYVIMTKENGFITLADEVDEDKLYKLNFEPEIMDSTQDSEWLVLPEEASNALFYIKKHDNLIDDYFYEKTSLFKVFNDPSFVTWYSPGEGVVLRSDPDKKQGIITKDPISVSRYKKYTMAVQTTDNVYAIIVDAKNDEIYFSQLLPKSKEPVECIFPKSTQVNIHLTSPINGDSGLWEFILTEHDGN